MIEITQIDYNVAKDFLLPRHYSGRIPSISYAYAQKYNSVINEWK